MRELQKGEEPCRICGRQAFDLTHTIAAPVFEGCTFPEVLLKINAFVVSLGRALSPDEYDNPAQCLSQDRKVAPTALTGPLIVVRAPR